MPLQVFDTAQDLMQAAAREMARLAAAPPERGYFALALSGGSTPLGAYRLMGCSPLVERVPWRRLHLFWGDERCLPPEHPESNFGQAMEALGKPDGLRFSNLHRIPAESGPGLGAELYRDELIRFFGGKKTPVFDLVLLGLGPDGHVASLFPESRAAGDRKSWVLPVEAPDHLEPKVPRVSLGFKVITAAKRIWLLAVGAKKAEAVAAVLKGKGSRLPAAVVKPSARVSWLLDREAAKGMS